MTQRLGLTGRLDITLRAGLTAALLLCALPGAWSQTSSQPESQPTTSGPIRLRQPVQGSAATPAAPTEPRPDTRPEPEYRPSEFERHVQRQLPDGQARRFGADLASLSDAVEAAPQVPADYAVQTGDELVITIWGSIDADLRLIVDRSGRISIPRVGPVMVAGTRYADLSDLIARRTAQTFKNFQVSVSLGQLRGMRVYVTGFVAKPGPLTVSSLTTLAAVVLRAGGPSAAGSLRNIQVRRGNQTVSQFDLYDLLLRGDKSADRVLQPDDVVHVGALGPQVAVIGSVNRPAIFETRPGETLGDLLAMAGGFNAVADSTQLSLERLTDQGALQVLQLRLPADRGATLSNGDVLRAFSAYSRAMPAEQLNKRVRIEGEVLKPGDYLMPPGSSLRDLVSIAGGMTKAAFAYGTEFTRESARLSQQENYDRALRDMETASARSVASARQSSQEELATQSARTAANARLIDRLRALRPTGRVVLQVPQDRNDLPELLLEDGDRLRVPARPSAVGIFGSVFNTGSYLYSGNRTVEDYLRLAGGPTRGADERSIFLIRANGSVSSALQDSSWFSRNSSLLKLEVGPGDTIFVPEELDKTTLVQDVKDWTQILYQFGIGLAGMKSAIK